MINSYPASEAPSFVQVLRHAEVKKRLKVSSAKLFDMVANPRSATVMGLLEEARQALQGKELGQRQQQFEDELALRGELGRGQLTESALERQLREQLGLGGLDIDRQRLYQRVGYIAQTTCLFNDTLRSNICLGTRLTARGD